VPVTLTNSTVSGKGKIRPTLAVKEKIRPTLAVRKKIRPTLAVNPVVVEPTVDPR
jgi:hypothetical protein